MEFRRSQWTESISTILRKTEMNLVRIHTPYHEEYPRNLNSVTYQASFYDNGMTEPIQRPPTRNLHSPHIDYKDDTIPVIQQEINTVKTSLEKLLQDRLRSQKKDIEDIGDRLAGLEIRSQDLDRFKEETKISLNNIEKRCLSEIKRIENAGKGFVTKEDLNLMTESVTKANLSSFKALEYEIEQLKNGDFDIKKDVFRMAEEKIRDASKKFVSISEFSSFKEGVFRDYEDRVKEMEESVDDRLEKFRSHYERETSAYEGKILDVKKTFDEKEEKINRRLAEIEGNLDKGLKKQKEEKEKIMKEIEKIAGMADLTELEFRLDSLENGLKKAPKEGPADLSEFAQKTELKTLQIKLLELENYKKSLDTRIFEIEKKVVELERDVSESSEADIDSKMNKELSGKGSMPFVKLESDKKAPAFTNINIENFGESDSDSQYISPHTSPMNQLNLLKKHGNFDLKPKAEPEKIKTNLIVVDEDPDIENKDNSYSKNTKTEPKKAEVKHFPVDTFKIEPKKNLEDSGKASKAKEEEKTRKEEQNKIKENESKGVNLFIPEPAKKKEESESDSSDSSFGLGLSAKPAKPAGFGKPGVPAQGVKSAENENLKKNNEKKLVVLDDDDDEFGLFSTPAVKPKPVLNPVLAKPSEAKPQIVQEKNIDDGVSRFVQMQYDAFVNDEISECLKYIRGQSQTASLPAKQEIGPVKGGVKKIPDNVKGMNFHKLLSNESESSCPEDSESQGSDIEYLFKKK